MSQTIDRTEIAVRGKAAQKITDFAVYLKRYGFKYTVDNYHYRVGICKEDAGWIFQLSCVRLQVEALFEAVFPYFAKEKIPFKIYRTEDLNHQMLNGDLGYVELGKVVTVFPPAGRELEIANSLNSLTQRIKGPAVPTDRKLGNVLYVRYGAINPQYLSDAAGNRRSFYRNKLGVLVEDQLTVPYKPAKFVAWPFASLAKQKPPGKRMWFKRRYRVIYWIKQDAKGFVGKGGCPWTLDWCLVKEGLAHMCCDDKGRDIHDRLTWQLDVQRDLEGKVRVPRIKDYFKKEDNYYLIMEFIEGPSFHEVIAEGHMFRAWFSVDHATRLRLVDHFLQILEQIRLLHSEGYIHRDITPGNFVIHKGKEYLIDMEMTYSEKMGRPNPPFRMGTFGFMSPEQLETLTPTVKEDIYAIGASMVVLFTMFGPLKLTGMDGAAIVNTLLFYTGDIEIAKVIASSMNPDPALRPELNHIRDGVVAYRGRIASQIELSPPYLHAHTDEVFDRVIQGGINGLSLPCFLDKDRIWISQVLQAEGTVGNQVMDRTIFRGMATGVTGILYALAAGAAAGYDTKAVAASVNNSFSHLQREVLQAITNGYAPGLFGGTAGMAIMLRRMVRSGLLRDKTVYHQYMNECFSAEPQEPSLWRISAWHGRINVVLISYERFQKTSTKVEQEKYCPNNKIFNYETNKSIAGAISCHSNHWIIISKKAFICASDILLCRG